MMYMSIMIYKYIYINKHVLKIKFFFSVILRTWMPPWGDSLIIPKLPWWGTVVVAITCYSQYFGHPLDPP